VWQQGGCEEPERDPLTYCELQQRDVTTADDIHWASDGAAEISTEAVQLLPRPI